MNVVYNLGETNIRHCIFFSPAHRLLFAIFAIYINEKK
jgi:hypothetical protein